MRDNSTIIRGRQLAIRRELDRRSISLKIVSMDSEVPYASLLSYLPAEGSREPAVMPVSVLYALIGHVPDDLLSLLLPEGRVIVRAPEGVDHDEAATAMRNYLGAKDAAHHPDSPGGREISECEDESLRARLTLVGSVAA